MKVYRLLILWSTEYCDESDDGPSDGCDDRFQLSTPSLQGLLALCALGLLQGDLTLTQATLQELSGLVKGGDKLCDVAMLTAALKVQQVCHSTFIFTVRVYTGLCSSDYTSFDSIYEPGQQTFFF